MLSQLMMRSNYTIICLFLLMTGLFASQAHGQVLYGSLVGTINDQSGGVVAGATVASRTRALA